MPKSKGPAVVSWIAQLVAAVILGFAGFTKLTGDEGSVAIFEALGMPEIARYAIGVAELLAAVMLIAPPTITLGAVLGLGIISGAIVSHIAKLGIEIEGVHEKINGPDLFIMACVVFVACLVVLFIRRRSIPIVGKMLAASSA